MPQGAKEYPLPLSGSKTLFWSPQNFTHKKLIFLSPWRNMLELNPVSSDYETPMTLEPEGSSSYLTWYILL